MANEILTIGKCISPFCRTEWFHLHVKIAFFHLSVWLIGQGGWKSHCRPGFNSWQFRHKYDVGQKLQILNILKLESFDSI